ncbi:MAG: TolC family outer membrane protein, partial [Pseudomonadota bacterium]
AIGRSSAYRDNPGLQSERFRARATDERVPEALSGYRPKAYGEAFYGYTSLNRKGSELGRERDRDTTYGYNATIEQPIFDGFRTRNGVREAESEVRAAHQDLRARENEVLLQTATAYFDVLADEGIVLYRRKSLTALRRELVGARSRLERGRITVTDLEQLKQRTALARSDLEKASARERISALRFTRVTGRKAASLRMPRLPSRHLPKSLRAAARIAEANSPIIAAAALRHDAAKHAVNKIRGELLPDARIVGSYDRSFNETGAYPDEEAASIVGRVRVPLYQGGAVSARVRQAKSSAAGRDREIQDARLRIGEAVGAAWTEFKTARRRLGTDRLAVKAGEKALSSIREEERGGQRSVIDVLDAERELVNARIRLLNTRRDVHVSAYALLRAIGELTIKKMAPGVEQYDAKAHYRRCATSGGARQRRTLAAMGFSAALRRRGRRALRHRRCTPAEKHGRRRHPVGGRQKRSWLRARPQQVSRTAGPARSTPSEQATARETRAPSFDSPMGPAFRQARHPSGAWCFGPFRRASKKGLGMTDTHRRRAL